MPAELGIEVGAVRVNMEQVRARKRKIVEQFRTSSEKRFASGQPELVRGEARFVAPKEIVVALKAGGERAADGGHDRDQHRRAPDGAEDRGPRRRAAISTT